MGPLAGPRLRWVESGLPPFGGGSPALRVPARSGSARSAAVHTILSGTSQRYTRASLDTGAGAGCLQVRHRGTACRARLPLAWPTQTWTVSRSFIARRCSRWAAITLRRGARSAGGRGRLRDPRSRGRRSARGRRAAPARGAHGGGRPGVLPRRLPLNRPVAESQRPAGGGSRWRGLRADYSFVVNFSRLLIRSRWWLTTTM
jgi:hypothetical protein